MITGTIVTSLKDKPDRKYSDDTTLLVRRNSSPRSTKLRGLAKTMTGKGLSTSVSFDSTVLF